MLYRTVPKNGDEISALSFGCMRLPGKRDNIGEQEAERLIFSGLDRGINYLDTAYPYHKGKSEPFLGKILSKNGYRRKVKLATKLPQWMTVCRDDMDRLLDEQLKRLQTDYIDYYLVHGVNGEAWEKCKNDGVFGFLDSALKDGKILNAGFSFHGAPKDFIKIVDDYDWTFCQIQYNFLDTKNQAGTDGLNYAASKDLAVIVMEPLRGGNLAKTPPEEVKSIWAESDINRTPVEWSLKWLLDHEAVTSVLSGMNAEKQLQENLKIASKTPPNSLTNKDRALVGRAADAYRKLMKCACTGCRYCMPCPAGVDIPYCFETYNSYHTFKDKRAKLMYTFFLSGISTEKTGYASQCIECGKCVSHCPQQIPIPEILKDVKKDMEGIFTKPLAWFIKKMFKVKKRKD